jgi:predicted deacylase
VKRKRILDTRAKAKQRKADATAATKRGLAEARMAVLERVERGERLVDIARELGVSAKSVANRRDSALRDRRRAQMEIGLSVVREQILDLASTAYRRARRRRR